MTDTAKPAPQPLTVALTRLLASFPRRKMPDKYLGMYFYMNASLQIHDLLDTWTRHEVKQLKIGPFTMDDAAIQKSFRLPVWVKEERGPHAELLARGGRYDDVGEVFGRRRPAVGFSLDLKSVVEHVGFDGRRAAIRAPWSEDEGLRAAVRRLRVQGEAVVCVLPGHEQEVDEFECDRELVAVDGLWVVRAC